MTATVERASKRPYVKDLVVQFGLLSSKTSLLTPSVPNAKKAEQFHKACPTCGTANPHRVRQRYVCSDDPEHGPFMPDELLTCTEIDGNVVIVDAEAVEAAKASDLPEKLLELRSHPYQPEKTFASGSAYVLIPSSPNDKFYAVLLQLIDDDGLVRTETGPKMLVGEVALRKGTEAFVRVERWGGHLVLRQLLRPEDVDSFPEIDAGVETKMVDLARQLVDAQAEEFDPEAYRADVRERLAAVVAAAQDGEVLVPAHEAREQQSTEDLMAALEAAVAVAQKPARKTKAKAGAK